MTEESTKSLLELSDSIFRLKAIAISQLLAIASRCSDLKAKPENRPLYQLNLLDIVPTEEPHTSKFLSAILNYTENGKHIILESTIMALPIGDSIVKTKEPTNNALWFGKYLQSVIFSYRSQTQTIFVGTVLVMEQNDVVVSIKPP